jgi:hypothetical protein
MRKTLRLGLVAAAAAAVLASASSALGAYAPKLLITTTDETTAIKFSQTNADDPTARVQILVPGGFSGNFVQGPGTNIGALEGSVIAGAFGGATVPVAGTIVAGDPSNAALKATAKQCTGTEDHAAIWLLNVTAAGQSLPNPVPLFLDPIAVPPFNAFASASIQLCLPPPPAAAFQIKLLEASLLVGNTLNIFGPPSTAGAYRWTAINTPYKADNTVNAAGTVETQGIETSPVDSNLTAKRITKTRRVKHKRFTDIFYSYSVRLTGSVQAGGQAAGGANYQLFAGGEDAVAEGTTNNSGAFTKTMKLTKTTAFHAVYTREAAPLVGASCIPPLPLAPGVNMPCASVTQGGFVSTTEEQRVVKPKLTHKRIKNKKKKKPKH